MHYGTLLNIPDKVVAVDYTDSDQFGVLRNH